VFEEDKNLMKKGAVSIQAISSICC